MTTKIDHSSKAVAKNLIKCNVIIPCLQPIVIPRIYRTPPPPTYRNNPLSLTVLEDVRVLDLHVHQSEQELEPRRVLQLQIVPVEDYRLVTVGEYGSRGSIIHTLNLFPFYRYSTPNTFEFKLSIETLIIRSIIGNTRQFDG